MKVLAWAGWLCVLGAMSTGVVPAQSQAPLTASPPPSQTPPPAASPTYKSLLEQGFEVKNILLLTADVSTRAAQTIEQDSVLVTLQKGAITATCWVTLTGWSLHNVSAVPCSPMT
jgi:hypothetical protein